MIYAEIKKKYAHLFVLIIIVLGFLWLYAGIQPKSASNNLSMEKYQYCKPMTKVEFIYFELKSEYEKGYISAYIENGDSGDQYWATRKVALNENEKRKVKQLLLLLNPNYSKKEKVTDVNLSMTYDEIKPYLKKLEKDLKCNTYYYTGMEAKEIFNQKEGWIDSASPYWLYLMTNLSIYNYEEFDSYLKEYNLTVEDGISKGYATKAVDRLGILIGFLTIIFSFQSYSEDTKYKTKEFLCTTNCSSVRYVLSKYMAIVAPLMCISLIYMIFMHGCFAYWNDKFLWGYKIEMVEFLKLVPVCIYPTILILVALGQLVGIVLQSEIVTFLILFLAFFGSFISHVVGYFSPVVIVRYPYFYQHTLLMEYNHHVLFNRLWMTLVSVFFVMIVLIVNRYSTDMNLRCLRRKIMKRRMTRKRNSKFLRTRKEKSPNKLRTKHYSKSLINYIIKQSFGRVLLFYVAFFLIAFMIAISNSSKSSLADLGENFLIFVALIIFVRLGNIEKNNGTEELVFTSNKNYLLLYMSRVLCGCILLFLLVDGPIFIAAKVNGVAMGMRYCGIYVSALFLGLMSLLLTELFENAFFGFAYFLAHYLTDVMTGGRFQITVLGYSYIDNYEALIANKLTLTALCLVSIICIGVCVECKWKGRRITKLYGNKNRKSYKGI